MVISQSEAKKAGEEAAVEEEENCLAEEVSGEDEESGEGGSSVKVEYSLEAEAYEVSEHKGGFF